jgi:hypothetical protein
MWLGVALLVAGVAFGLGFFFVPPQVLIPELIRDPQVRMVPEGLVGLWLAAIGLFLLLSGTRTGRRGGGR